MEDSVQNPGRRRLLAAAVVPELERFLSPLRPKVSSYEDWFNAIRLDDARRIESLLARGFDPNSIEPELFDSGLILAIRHKSVKVIALLLSLDHLNIEMLSRNGDTALMIAAWLGDKDTALALIDKGAQVNRPGWTALHYAAASGSLPVIRRLLEESAFIDTESPNGTTPLMMAARSGRREAVLLLIDEGAELMLKNERGMTAADFARAQGHEELARLIDERALASGNMTPRATQMPVPGDELSLPAEGSANPGPATPEATGAAVPATETAPAASHPSPAPALPPSGG